jgi:hypothetical protein
MVSMTNDDVSSHDSHAVDAADRVVSRQTAMVRSANDMNRVVSRHRDSSGCVGSRQTDRQSVYRNATSSWHDTVPVV